MNKKKLTQGKLNRLIIYLTGILSAIGGILVITGWIKDIPQLKTFWLGGFPMKANLGAAFFFHGITLIMLYLNRKITIYLARVFSIVVILTGLITLAQYIFNWYPSFDLVLLKGSYDVPVRMAFNAALSCVVAGIIYLMISYRRTRSLVAVEFIIAILFSINIVGLTGFILGLEMYAEGTGYQEMAISANILFILISVSLLLNILDKKRVGIKPEQKLMWGMVLVATAFIFISVLTVSVIRKLKRSSDMVQYTLEVKNELNTLLTNIIDVETAVRGYLISNNEAYLIPMDSAYNKIDKSANRLKTLTMAESGYNQKHSLEVILENVELRTAHADSIRTAYKDNKETALQLFGSGRGNIISDSLRIQIGRANKQADILLKSNMENQTGQVLKSRSLIFAGVVGQLFLLYILYFIVKNNFQKRNRLENDLKNLNEELENRVEERTLSLKQSEERFRGTLEGLMEGCQIIGFDYTYIFLNREAIIQSRNDEEKLLGHKMTDVYPGIEGTDMFQNLKKCMDERTHISMENSFEYPDGSRSWFELKIEPVNEGAFILSRDISKSKEMQESLVQSEKKYKYLFEHNPQPMWIYDLSSLAFLEINTAAINKYGYSKEEFLGMTIKEIRPPEDEVSLMKNLAKPEKEIEISGPWRHKLKNGRIIFVQIISHQIDFEGRKGRLVLANDITKEKKAKDALNKLNRSLEERIKLRTRELEKANKIKSEFLANMSHEIRTPLNAVLGYSELLENLLTEPVQKEYLESIRSSGKNLLGLINDILDLSKVEAGKLELEYSFVNLKDFLSEFRNVFSLRITQKGLNFHLEISSDTPAYIYTDENRLRQIILNLLGNAIKFTEKGYIMLNVSVPGQKITEYKKDKRVEYVDLLIEIKDTGPGISEEMHKSIFEAFVQDKEGKRGHGGTGLGLAITKRLVELMNGKIEVRSKLGEGSSFIISLPDIEFRHSMEDDRHNIVNPGSISFEKTNILIVDDVEHNRKYISNALRDTKITVFEAPGGWEALEILKKNNISLVICDIRMPVMDGFELLDKIKKKTGSSHIPVVAYSASVMKDQKERIYNSSFAELLIKPVQVAELYSVLMKHLPHKTGTKKEKETKPGDDFNFSVIKDPDQLVSSLKNHITDKWTGLQKRQPISDVQELATMLIDLGESHNATLISHYGEKLIKTTETFNIGEMLQLLNKLPGIVDEHIRNLVKL